MDISELLGAKPTRLITISPDVSVMEAVHTMNQHRVGAVVVLENGSIAGIFTERDVLKRVLAESKNPSSSAVRDVMTADPTTISPRETIEDAMSIMTEKRHRHLPVLRDGQLVGMVSIGDITRALLEENEMEASNLRSYITGSYL